jgi:hypothetical protein
VPILAFTQAPRRTFAPREPVELLTFELRRTVPGKADQVLKLVDPYLLQLGVDGLDDVPVTVQATTPAGWDGENVDDLVAEPVEMFLPLLVEGGSLEGLRDLKTKIRDFTNPRRGPVRLRVTRPNGQFRERVGFRTRMVNGALDAESWGVSWQKFGPVLRCSDPFYTEPGNPWHVEWSVRSNAISPLPILPVRPAASNALNGTNDVSVDGDVETFPIWTLRGPFTSVAVRDVARGLQWTLTVAAAPGDVWTVDCRKGRQGVFSPAGVRSRGRLSNDAYLWGLEPGVSQVSTTVTGGADGTMVIGDAPSRWESY